MRVICPNCGAQYEVPPEAIPEQGRDVQCSACGHVWFEGGRAAPTAAAAAAAPAPEPGPDPAGEGRAALRQEEPPEPAAGLSGEAGGEEDPPASGAEVPLPRRSVSPEVARILREEARREAEARAAEARAAAGRARAPGAGPNPSSEPPPPPGGGDASGPARADRPAEPLPGLPTTSAEPAGGRAAGPAAEEDESPVSPLPPPAAPPAAPSSPPASASGPAAPPAPERQRAEEARRRIARLRGETAPLPGEAVMAPAAAPAAPAAAPAAARRDRLPDIEEINSSLRVSAPAARPDRAAAPDRRGFRLGLGGGLLIAALLALPYVYAPRIASALPWTVPVLRPYVAAVDAARIWLDERMRDLLEALGTAPEGAAASGSATPTLPAVSQTPPQVQVEPPAIPLPAAE